MKLYLEEVNDLVCNILDIINEEVGLSQAEEDSLFDLLQEYLDTQIGRGEYKHYN